jgi:OOP family OmpA-OmpF porin
MSVQFRKTRYSLIALGIALSGLAAQAQTMPAQASSSNAYDASRTSWIPYTNNGYVGLNVGRSRFSTSCVGGFACDRSDTSGHIYLGGYFSPYFGAEIGYTDLGNIGRAGGRTEADGINLSLVGRVPLSQNFSIYGKLGGTYGRTRVSSAAGTGIATGRETGWGAAYAVGLSWDINRNWSALLEFDNTRFQFAGNTHDNVRATSLGLKYSF